MIMIMYDRGAAGFDAWCMQLASQGLPLGLKIHRALECARVIEWNQNQTTSLLSTSAAIECKCNDDIISV